MDAILLHTAEMSDLHTVGNLMLLNKQTYALLKNYQHSIVKYLIKDNAEYAPEMWPSGFMSRRVLGASGQSLQPNSFPAMRELLKRNADIQQLFAPVWPLGQAMAWLELDFPLDQDLYYELVKNLATSCRILDHLSDCAANVGISDNHPPVQMQSAPANDPLPLSLRRVRRAQMAVLRSLSVTDMAFLVQLTAMAAEYLARKCPIGLAGRNSPGYVDAFREVLLRHGSGMIVTFMDGKSVAHRALSQAFVQAHAWRKTPREIRCGDLEQYEEEDNYVYMDEYGPIQPTLAHVLCEAFTKKSEEQFGPSSCRGRDKANLIMKEKLGVIDRETLQANWSYQTCSA